MKAKNNFNWPSGLYLIGYHLILIALLPVYFVYYGAPSGTLIGLSAALLYITGLSITAGYHRLYSHLTYKTNKWVEAVLLFFGSMATQGSALRWGHDHRKHHAHIDKEEDPYAVTRGFWYAHILWMFSKQPPIDPKIVADLIRNKMLVFQDKYYEILMLITNLLSVAVVGYITGDYFGAFVFAWLLRQFFLHHFTWFINSLAHYWGHQNYSTEHSAVDNYVISLLTFGEGYHNYHHTFANDYRNGIRWYHFDPTKWLIWTLSKLGLANSLRKVSEAHINKQMIQEHKRALLEKLTQSFTTKKEELEQKVSEYTDGLIEKLSKFQQLMNEYKATKQDAAVMPTCLKTLSKEIRGLKKSIKHEWRCLKKLSKTVMRLKAA